MLLRAAAPAAGRPFHRALRRLPASAHQLQHQHQHQRRRARRAIAAAAAEDASCEEAVTFTTPLDIRTAQGMQLAGLISDPIDISFNAAISTYMRDLLQEQRAEEAMSAAIADSATAEDWEKDPVLLRRMAVVREAERGGVLQEIIYLVCLRRLLFNGNLFVNDLALLDPARSAQGLPEGLVQQQDLLQGTQEQPAPLFTPAAADALAAYVNNTLGEDMAAAPAETPLSIDRVQVARLYAGFVEFGYFARRLESLCIEGGIDMTGTSDAMIAHANAIPDDQLAGFCAVHSADGWYAAVRHIGGLFALPPNRDPYDALGLPFPCLATTLSSIQLEPAANVAEHFNPPGSAAALAAKARDRQARGWNMDPSELEPSLPEADLVSFALGTFQRLLLEAGVFGALLRDAEAQLQADGYRLASLEQRREHAGSPAP